MKIEQIMNDLKNRIYYPVYFLYGEEPYYIDIISDFIEKNVLEESEKDFNQTIAYGRDVNIKTIVSMAKRFPMMASHQVIIIKEAQNIEKIEDLISYIEDPLESTLLVLHFKYKKIDKRTKIYKTIEKKGVLFESAKLYDNQIGGWINRYLEKKGYRITPKATMMLKEFLGTSLSKIENEIDKILINLKKNSEITDEIVEQFVGISKDFNYFELQNAIGSKNYYKANQIVLYFAANPKENPLMRNLVMLYGFVVKLLIYHQLKDKSQRNVISALGINKFFIKDYQIAARNYSLTKLTHIIGYLKEYDLKIKGIHSLDIPDGELLKELIFKIMH